MGLPQKLYHWTYLDYLDSILDNWLWSVIINKSWSFSRENVVCLTSDPIIAYKYCINADNIDISLKEKIIIIEIDTDTLVIDKLFIDINNSFGDTIEYHWIIYKSSISDILNGGLKSII